MRLFLGAHPDVLVLWSNETGQARHEGSDARVRYGLCVGSADLVGIRVGTGRFVAVELKTGAATLSYEQRLFRDLVLRCGGEHWVVRDLADALRVVEGRIAR